MSNSLSTFIKKKIAGKNQNLVSLDEPYQVMADLLKQKRITGIIDAGASDGMTSKKFLRKFPSADVYAFEPNPLYRYALNQYAKNDSRFHPYFVALSDREGTAELYVTESPGSTSLLAPTKSLKEINPAGASVKSLEKVDVITVDRWAECNGNLPVQVMKFDIQAGELNALRGATRVLKASTLLVYTEIWFNPAYNGGALYSEVDLFLRRYDFILYDIFKPRYNPNGVIMWANAIFVNVQRLGI